MPSGMSQVPNPNVGLDFCVAEFLRGPGRSAVQKTANVRRSIGDQSANFNRRAIIQGPACRTHAHDRADQHIVMFGPDGKFGRADGLVVAMEFRHEFISCGVAEWNDFHSG